jgi:hypothetical protein
MNGTPLPSSLCRAASETQPAKGQPKRGCSAKLAQKRFIAALQFDWLAFVRLALSHHSYGVLPNRLDPHWQPGGSPAWK